MESKVKDENYYQVQGFMVNRLKLKGNELHIYSIIYGFSQLEGQKFNGSLSYLAQWTNSTKQGVIKVLKSLEEKGLIEKEVNFINGVKHCKYYVTKFNSIKQSLPPMQQSLIGGIKQSLPNNNKLDNIDNNIELSIGENSNFSDFPQSNPRSLEEENLTKLQRGAGGSAEKLAKRMQQFEEWYSKYPRKDGKSDAMKKFQKLKEAEIEAILIHTEKYAEIRKGKEKQYTLKASNYLSQRCWEDEDFLEARTNNIVSRRTGKTSVLEFDNENREF